MSLEATKRYAKEIFTGVPGHDLRLRKNVNKQVGVPIFSTFFAARVSKIGQCVLNNVISAPNKKGMDMERQAAEF